MKTPRLIIQRLGPGRNFSKYVPFMLRDSNSAVNSVSDSDAQRSIQSESQHGARPSWQETQKTGGKFAVFRKTMFCFV